MLCALLALSQGVDGEVIKETLRTFKGVEHRIEFVCERSGVRYINDSKGTNPDSTRIEVNGELQGLREAVDACIDLLSPGGRIVILTFHSLEDRIVKSGIARRENGCTCPREAPICTCGFVQTLRSVSRKPILPSAEEIEINPRSRSAKLRVAERV